MVGGLPTSQNRSVPRDPHEVPKWEGASQKAFHTPPVHAALFPGGEVFRFWSLEAKKMGPAAWSLLPMVSGKVESCHPKLDLFFPSLTTYQGFFGSFFQRVKEMTLRVALSLSHLNKHHAKWLNSFWRGQSSKRRDDWKGWNCVTWLLYPNNDLSSTWAMPCFGPFLPVTHLHLWRCVGWVVPNQINSSRWKGQDSDMHILGCPRKLANG